MHRRLAALLVAVIVAAGCAPADAGSRPAGTPSVAPGVALGSPPTRTREPVVPSPEPVATPASSPAPSTPAPTSEAPPPVAAATPTIRPSRDRPDRPARPYELNVASHADFVRQYTFEWCVGASLQMARSIITGERDESRASQRRLWELARTLTVGSPYGGANPAGWAAALNEMDLGPYRLVSLPTFDDAVRRAAVALVRTRRPVGLVMWAGRHAWVMTGFTATANPRRNPDARITRVRVMDPLYPHGSRWGASPAPNQLIRLRTLARQFVRRDRPDYDFGVDPGWLLVLPVEPGRG